VTAAFGELTVPLFGKDNGAIGYRRLELSFAGRYEHYGDFGQAATPKFGMVWAPFDAVALRGTGDAPPAHLRWRISTPVRILSFPIPWRTNHLPSVSRTC